VHFSWRLTLACGWKLLCKARVLSCYLVELVRKFMHMLVFSTCFMLHLSKTIGRVQGHTPSTKFHLNS
jgi:hypothetical protein